MKNKSILFYGIFLLCVSFISNILPGWQIKENAYSLTFKTKGAKGSFRGLTGTIHFDTIRFAESKFDVAVDVKTIDTGIGMKNKHALAEDFFDAEHYPEIRFKSSNVVKSDTAFTVTGLLTIKDISKEISFPFTFDQTGQIGVFKGIFEINRNDFNLLKKGVGELVKVELNVPVIQDTIR
ncbi:YceI-like domain-containing protein [Dyadobacter koreensis]|uniref:YceI-like domain-containing protein n=1 Tax=Dyadobacter koreensis TaxID=408657 RepID=A0A1H6XLV9_9BACT|nr:YceI family protein [Dyadobacter koreensis]SEJ30071.1 YceI-like domain-containing protein [Dyadobacter koreensis]